MLTRGRTLLRRGRPACRSGFAGSVALSMPLGLMSGGPFKPFSRAISARCSATNCSRAATLPNNRKHQFPQLDGGQAIEVSGANTHSLNPSCPRRGKQKLQQFSNGIESRSRPTVSSDCNSGENVSSREDMGDLQRGQNRIRGVCAPARVPARIIARLLGPVSGQAPGNEHELWHG